MKKLFFCLLVITTGLVYAQPSGLFSEHPNVTLRHGNLDYKKGKYSEAIDKYNKVFRKNQDDPLLNYNLGTFLYRQGDYDTSAHFFENAIKFITDKKLKSKAYYNLGNAYMQKKQFDKAIQSYSDALKYNPDDDDARYNLTYALRNLKQQQQQQKPKDDNKDGDGEQDKNQQKDEKEKPEDDKMDKDRAREIINSLNDKEKDQNKDVKGKGNNINNKDW